MNQGNMILDIETLFQKFITYLRTELNVLDLNYVTPLTKS
jgi:hypothetical protein